MEGKSREEKRIDARALTDSSLRSASRISSIAFSLIRFDDSREPTRLDFIGGGGSSDS